MPEAGTEILFINKTAQSGKLSRSRGLERARIYSHVQRGSQNQPPRKAPDPNEVLYQQPDSWTPKQKTDEPKSPPKAALRPRSQPKKCKAKVHVKEVRPDSAADALQALHLSSNPVQLEPLNALSGGVGDPFDSLEVPISPYMEDLFKFCEPRCQCLVVRTDQIQTAAMSCLASSQSRRWLTPRGSTLLHKPLKIRCSETRCCVPHLLRYMPTVASLGMALPR